jgi:peptide/nickel transport system ATP-binding protein
MGLTETAPRLRGRRIGFVTQNPMTALDPVQRIGNRSTSRLAAASGPVATQARARTLDLLTQLRIPEPPRWRAWPHQLSGGMKQRIVIAMALAGEPDLIIADEPTTALDVTVQAQIIQILGGLVRDRGLALLLITHDMGVVAQVCDRVAVLYAGRWPKRGRWRHLCRPGPSLYRRLIGCIPQDGMARGQPARHSRRCPRRWTFRTGCRFHPRCPRASDLCRPVPPVPTQAGAGSPATLPPPGGGHA